MSQPDDSAYHNPRRVHVAGFLIFLGAAVVVLAGLAAAFSGLGSRWDWWRFQAGFTILQWSVVACAGGTVASLIGLLSAALQREGRLALRAVPAILVGLAILAYPLSLLEQASSVPAIHDITTDTQTPPQFQAVVPQRAAAMNEVAYPGGDTAARQQQAYPWITPLLVDRTPHSVFEAARRQVEAEGWALHTADRAAGRIEATATSFWFGFKDDIVVRITETDDGRTRVDVRSASRVGISDLGVNADRVHAFLTALEERLRG
ncbi:DUF1499 domain-containing protein [Rhodovibrio salinarum]|uniref:DUF1499 domain-containing protein n=1 Tax=Rhodovibrio salinarum TaxID=1087 RepID=A0A934QFI1_9PROT|nr:DUF1499 domain-containing protein [Rhodovibrio salinarum]MBK1696061.1 DUF1499 domain-containing protein [Rhodovibrio salinarum]